MKTKPDTLWNRLCKRTLPKTQHNAPAMDEDRNSNTLSRLEENDPVLVCIRDHAFAQFANDMAQALDLTVAPGLRLSHADSASGLKRFLEDLEFRRQGWNEERIRALREEDEQRRKTAKTKQ